MMMQQLRCKRQQWNINKQWEKRRSFIDVHLDIEHEHSTLFYWIILCPLPDAGYCDACVRVRTVAFGTIAHGTAPCRGRCIELNKEIASDVRVESAQATGSFTRPTNADHTQKSKLFFQLFFFFTFVVLLLVRRYVHVGSIVVCRSPLPSSHQWHRRDFDLLQKSKSHEQKNVYFSVRTFQLRNQ